jgi:hypothetical protein
MRCSELRLKRHSTILRMKDESMRRLLTICACVATFAALALAETWTGRLVDASCVEQQKSATACDPSSSTTAFALIVSGKAYRLDEAGNSKAMEALKDRADRSANPNQPASPRVAAKISGTMDSNNNIKVDSIQVQ